MRIQKTPVPLSRSVTKAVCLAVALSVSFHLAFQCVAQGILQIGFDAPPLQASGTSISVQQYFQEGIWFRPLGVLEPNNTISHRRGGGQVTGFVPDNGTAYLAAHVGSSLVFNFLDDSLFGVSSVDLASYSVGVPDFTWQVVGYRPDGTSVTAGFSGSGIDFQTYHLGPEFVGLTRVEIPSFGWSLDNLVVLVPEPGTWALIMAGGLLFGARHFRKRETAQ